MTKKLCIILSLFVFLPAASMGERVTVNINASVVERSCTLSTGSVNSTVELQPGDLRASKLGVPFSGTRFSVSLENCPDNLSSAYIEFNGESDPLMSNLLKNTSTDASSARGIALGLYDGDSNNIDIRNNRRALKIEHGVLTNVFSFFAYYVRVNSTSSAGKVLSVANFELSYD